METKKESKSKDKPTPEETKEFWKDWRKRHRLTSTGKSLEKIKKDLQEEHREGCKIFTYIAFFFRWILIVIIELSSIATPMIGLLNPFFKEYRDIYKRKERKNKTT